MVELYERAAGFFRELQSEICGSLEVLDGAAAFREDTWSREGGGGGISRVIAAGGLFEKAGVNWSSVEGELPEDFAGQLPAEGRDFRATGVSLVLHPYSPMVPTVHANFRYLEKGDRRWFGGGADLTPYYLSHEDAEHFHRTLRAVCERHPTVADYPRFKAWCDDYFYLPHRGEARGIGGIFFDYLERDLEDAFAFVRDAGRAFVSAYGPIVERRRQEPWGQRERAWQLIRRGRYVEFNLIYDRGTVFGLKTQGRTESILMSLPPEVHWVYDHRPEPGSREAALVAALRSTSWIEPRS
jgi:coproporphyrinogen III oxidase